MSGLPWCAVCQRPVMEVLAYDDPATLERVFTVRCHGAREVVRILKCDLVRGMTIKPGVAFGRPLLKSRTEINVDRKSCQEASSQQY